jgi:hypothetical protein
MLSFGTKAFPKPAFLTTAEVPTPMASRSFALSPDRLLFECLHEFQQ